MAAIRRDPFWEELLFPAFFQAPASHNLHCLFTKKTGTPIYFIQSTATFSLENSMQRIILSWEQIAEWSPTIFHEAGFC